MSNQNSVERFTLRTDEDQAIIIRHSYELNRQKRILEGRKVLSLSEFIIRLINKGLEIEPITQKEATM